MEICSCAAAGKVAVGMNGQSQWIFMSQFSGINTYGKVAELLLMRSLRKWLFELGSSLYLDVIQEECSFIQIALVNDCTML